MSAAVLEREVILPTRHKSGGNSASYTRKNESGEFKNLLETRTNASTSRSSSHERKAPRETTREAEPLQTTSSEKTAETDFENTSATPSPEQLPMLSTSQHARGKEDALEEEPDLLEDDDLENTELQNAGLGNNDLENNTLKDTEEQLAQEAQNHPEFTLASAAAEPATPSLHNNAADALNAANMQQAQLSDGEIARAQHSKATTHIAEIAENIDITSLKLGSVDQATEAQRNQKASEAINLTELTGLKINKVPSQNQPAPANPSGDAEPILSPKLLLAEESSRGQTVLSQISSNTRPSRSEQAPIASSAAETALPSAVKPELANLNSNGGEAGTSARKKPATQLPTMTEKSENVFQISFQDNIPRNTNALSNALGANITHTHPPKPQAQIALAVNAAASSGTNGAKEITINLFPDALGAVKVEILSAIGQDGVSKIQSIKIIADRRETLEILEKSRIDLEKSLKEVTDTKEEASLEFEMNQQGEQQRGGYFESLEERANWMSKFADITSEDAQDSDPRNIPNELLTSIPASTGYVTKYSVNIMV
ncbi:MAG: hypothetical protein COA94_00800 [Rickettsiales bacterium]|nr:MAG: hypothetical protein COA94_00800 [Rickettsiales bacterium]